MSANDIFLRLSISKYIKKKTTINFILGGMLSLRNLAHFCLNTPVLIPSHYRYMEYNKVYENKKSKKKRSLRKGER